MNAMALFVLWACKSDGWERDYIHELFPPEKNFVHVDYVDFVNQADPIKPKVLVYNVENSGADGTYQQIRQILKENKVIILVHTADEFQGSARKWKYGEGIEVYNLVARLLS